MIEMRVLDSNVLVAYYNKRDSMHAKSMAVFEGLDARKEKAFIPVPVLFETGAVLSRLLKDNPAVAGICKHACEANELMHSTGVLVEEAMTAYKSTRKLSFVDCYLLWPRAGNWMHRLQPSTKNLRTNSKEKSE